MDRLFSRTAILLACLVAAILAVVFVPPHTVAAAATPAHLDSLRHALGDSLPMIGLAGAGLIGALRTVNADNNAAPIRASVLLQHNKLAAWISYANRNKLLSTTIATQPVCARGTTATKAKTTAATVALAAGAAVAVAATDDAWTLTGGNLATAFARKYLLLVDSAGTTFTVMASDDQASAGNCSFTNLPADGLAIVGVVTIANASGAVFIPGTTALNATGITATFKDGHGDDSVLPFGTVVPT